MNIQQLINELQKVEDKEMDVVFKNKFEVYGEVSMIDIEKIAFTDYLVLQELMLTGAKV